MCIRDRLDSTVASYSYNGKKSDITAREAIESQYSLDTVKDGDGNYTAPSADVILSYVRNKILLDAAEDEGITVSSKAVSYTHLFNALRVCFGLKPA